MGAWEEAAEAAGPAACRGRVADTLGGLVPQGWQVLHDVPWPGRPNASLDHVLVGPGGVVVVAARNWTGDVRVASGVLWQGRYARMQAVEGALAQCAAVASVLAPQHRRLVRPLICMAAQPDLFGVTGSDVAVAGIARVAWAIGSLPPVLDVAAVDEVYRHLRRELGSGQQPGTAAFGSARAGMGTRPAGRPPTGTPPGGRSRSDSAARHPAGRNLPAGGRAGGARHARSAGARQHVGAGAGRLALLAVLVIFAVYVLPYWPR